MYAINGTDFVAIVEQIHKVFEPVLQRIPIADVGIDIACIKNRRLIFRIRLKVNKGSTTNDSVQRMCRRVPASNITK
jgi:hypothetical protein